MAAVEGLVLICGGSRSGKHRHLSEEIFYVVEGSGYDLHWDVKFDCKDEFEWMWESEPKKFEWKEGDFVYIPPYVMHQHFNADPKNETRIIVINSRIVKKMGFDWFEQIENALGRGHRALVVVEGAAKGGERP